MSQTRRTIDRRRRVLYSTYHADPSGSTAASRREIQRLREARRPSATYGARVKRRLRGRWFSLVPVKRRSFTIVAGTLAAITVVLCLLHYLAVAWPALVYRPELARPFRLDQPDSFGRFYTTIVLAASAGAALMIYQLRRYRLDDYLGRYRLWRLVLIVMVLASINSSVSLLDWSGAILDATFGKRVALSGGDWIRIVVGLGSAVLGLRMIAEVRRCRASLFALLFACGFLLIPQAARWNVMAVDSVWRWTAVTSAPVMATTAIFVAMGAYLRSLYREVREIEDPVSISERLGGFSLRFWSLRFWLRRQSDDPSAEPVEVAKPTPPRKQQVVAKEPEPDLETKTVEKPRRRWFGLRAAKSVAPADEGALPVDAPEPVVAQEPAAQEPAAQDDAEPAEPKRGWFSRRRKATADEVAQQETAEPDEPAETDASPDEAAPKKSGGIGGWFSRKKSDAVVDGNTDANESSVAESDEEDADDGGNGETIDEDSIDWNNLSKAEKRRMKKQLRRQDRAA